jgi:hypothetical protein
MSDTHTEILSAFCDGEVVDPDVLAEALADSRARDALIDFARLRAAVAVTTRVPASLAGLRDSPARPRLGGWTVVAAAAAMVLLIVVSAALLPRTLFTRSTDQSPPSPSRVLRFEPGVDWHSQGGR